MIPHIDLLISPWFVIRITWSLHCWIALIKYCLSYTNHHFLFVVIDKLFSKLPKGTKLLQLTVCHGCKAGKSTHKPFPGSAKTTCRILEVVHSDLAGPMQVKSIQGLLYTATFIDDYSRHAVVYCLRSKDQFVVALQKFLSWAETQTSDKLCTLHS